jgi:hypothetical protein
MTELIYPSVDSSIIGGLGDVYKQAQQQAQKEAALAQLRANPNMGYDQAARLLIGGGDVQSGGALAGIYNQIQQRALAEKQLAETSRHAQATEGLGAQTLAETSRFHNLTNEQQKATLAETRRQHDIGEAKPITVPFGSALVDRKGNVIKETSGSGLLDAETINAMANQYRAGDTSVLTNLGRGAQGAENIVALRKRIAEINAGQGETGQEQANRNAEMFGVKAGQRTLGTKQANIEMAATEFQQVLPVVQKASQAVNRTNYPDLNKIIQAFNEKTGDPNIVAFGGGVNTLINLYGRAISPNGVATVSDKDHAREILQKAWSQGQFDAAVGMMSQEIDAALKSPEKVRDEMRKRFLTGVGAGSPANAARPAGLQTVPPAQSGGDVIVNTKEEYDRLPSGTPFTDKAGKKFFKP